MMNKKIVLMLLVCVVAGVMGGCSIAGDAIKSTWTPNIERCEGLEGKTVAEFKQQLGYPDIEPESIGRGAEGTKIYTFQKGHLFAQLVVKNDVIQDAECWRGPNSIPPSKRSTARFPYQR